MYAVSTYAKFTNLKTGVDVHQSMNKMGHAKITLVRDRIAYTRSVAQLVARTFIPKPYEHFDTPIHLDSDLLNCRADNLMWRPRWFAIKYQQQFRYENFHNDTRPRRDRETGIVYNSMKELCMANGVYYFDVEQSCYEDTYVPLTFQKFEHAD